MAAPYEFDSSNDIDGYLEVVVETPLGFRRISYEALRARKYPLTARGALALALDLEDGPLALNPT